MSIEERVARLEQRIDQLEQIEEELKGVKFQVAGLRQDLNAHASAFGDRMQHFERGLNRMLFVLGTIQVLSLCVLIGVLARTG